MHCGGTCAVCANLKQINPPQWKHIMHRLLIPIGEVASIRIQYIHYQRVCANTNTCTDLKQINLQHIKHHQLIPIGEVGIYKNATHASSEGVC